MITVVRMNRITTGKTQAFVTVNYYGMIIKGLKVIKALGEPFVSYPDEKGKDGKYHETVFPADQTAKFELESVILNYYKENK